MKIFRKISNIFRQFFENFSKKFRTTKIFENVSKNSIFLLREYPFSTYARRGGGGGGLAKSVRSTMSLLVTVTSFCVRGGEGVKNWRNFAYVLNGWSLRTGFTRAELMSTDNFGKIRAGEY